MDIKSLRKVDPILILLLFGLITFGLIFVFSATYRDNPAKYLVLKKQLIWVLIGLVIMSAAIIFDYRKLRAYAHPIYIINLIMLISVYLVGKTSLGAQRWIPIGSFIFQPSELSKVLIIITLAAYLSEKRETPLAPKQFIMSCLHVGIPLLLILKQPDLGTSLVFIAILLGSILFSEFNFRYIVALLIIGTIAGYIMINFQLLSPYQMKRLLIFTNPNIDPLGSGYNLLQSQISVGSGGLVGKGLGKGTQTALNFLPHHDTDFIFSVIGEEWGFAGGAALLLLYLAFFFRGIAIATRTRDKFGSIIIGGIVTMLFFQVVVNIGMTIGIMPITGIPLPFISYGGSSMLTNLIATGLILNISSRKLTRL
jgi:rod shape determining protein RodA